MQLKKIFQYLILFIIGGISYYLIEILWSGRSHPAMIIVGGTCFVLIGTINKDYLSTEASILIRLTISCLVITVLEFIFGLVLNLGLGLGIWDYSKFKYNLMGQICLRYSIFWFFLSLPAIVLYNYLRYWLFGENKPNYNFIKTR
ncbi:MAG: hypothetical protein RIN55_05835 [Tissierellaceae bacterium]|nr:hypothetical protein [Tissierellaceae bacterium]